MKKILSLFLIILLSLTFIIGCSSNKSSDESNLMMKNEIISNDGTSKSSLNVGQGINDKYNANKTDNKGAAKTDRKVVQNAFLEIETINFDKAVTFVSQSTEQEIGYIQESSVSGGKSYSGNYKDNRSAHYVIRIPKDKLNSFLKAAQDIGVITNKRVTGDDITSQYFDTEARLKSFNIQEERLLKLLEKSENLKDVIELEKQLTDTRYQIENLTGTLKKWDNLVELATVDINIREVQEVTALKDKSGKFGDKIIDAFKTSVNLLFNGLKIFIIVLIGAVPFIIVGAVLYLVVRFGIKKYKNYKDKK